MNHLGELTGYIPHFHISGLGFIIFCDHKGLFTLQTAAGKNEHILDISPDGESFIDIDAMAWPHHSDSILVAPCKSDLFLLKLNTKQIVNMGRLRDVVDEIEVTPDDKYANIRV